MSLDTALAITSLAVAIGGLVPIYRRKAQARETTLAVIVSALVLLSAVSAWRATERQAELRYLSDEVMRLLAARPLTIYQLEQALPNPSFPLLLETVDGLVRSHQIQYSVLPLYDTSRNDFAVAVYSVQMLR